MGLEHRNLDHACNVIRRQILDEVKDLTLCFVIHKDKKRSEFLSREENQIITHPAGETALTVFQKHANGNRTEFLGLTKGQQKSLLSFNKQPFFLGLFYINTNDFESIEEAREHIYHLAWHAVNLLEHYKAEDNNYKLSGDIIQAKHTPINLSKSNLAADVFAAVTLELQGNGGSISNLALKRANLALSPTPNYQAEQYPYVVAIETTLQTFEELKQNFNAKIRISGHAIRVAKDINETYSDQSIKQWWGFCVRAQEMAWMGCKPDEILGAALHTSEDPYIRSIAYLIAETLDIKPGSLSTIDFYNPFTDHEANERIHNKACEESFQAVMSQTIISKNHHLFTKESHLQNRKLAEGCPLGWCAHAMLKAGAAYKNADPETPNIENIVENAFRSANTKVSWKFLHQSSKAFMKRRRQGHKIDSAQLEKMSKKFEDLTLFVRTFKATDKLHSQMEKDSYINTQNEMNMSDLNLLPSVETDDMTCYGATFRSPTQIQKTEDA